MRPSACLPGPGIPHPSRGAASVHVQADRVLVAMSGQLVFIAGFVIAFDHVASPVSCLVAVEVVIRFISARRHRSPVTVMRVKAVIDMAGKVFRAVEPRASANKHPANKPVGPVVAVRRATVWSVREVPIGAYGRHSNADGDLG